MCNLMFIRKLEIELISEILTLHQKFEGDVGCVVWDASIVLAKYLEETTKNSKLDLRNANVLELGAGVGCVGLTAACFGANVLLTDLMEIVPILELNVKENEEIIERHKGSADILSLKWGENVNIPFKPDLILLADCIYYKESIVKLLQTLRTLASENTRILLCQEMRESNLQRDCWEHFVENGSEDFYFNYVPLSEQNPEYRCSEIKVIELKKKHF